MTGFRYFRPASLTWWSGIVAIGLGAVAAVNPGPALAEFSEVLAVLLGGEDASPAGLMLIGAGLVGIGDKVDRMKIKAGLK